MNQKNRHCVHLICWLVINIFIDIEQFVFSVFSKILILWFCWFLCLIANWFFLVSFWWIFLLLIRWIRLIEIVNIRVVVIDVKIEKIIWNKSFIFFVAINDIDINASANPRGDENYLINHGRPEPRLLVKWNLPLKNDSVCLSNEIYFWKMTALAVE